MLKVNILPRLETIAETMDEIFSPSLAREEIVVRRGRIRTRSSGVKEVIMAAYTPKDGLVLLVETLNSYGKWETEMASSGQHYSEIEAAVNSLK